MDPGYFSGIVGVDLVLAGEGQRPPPAYVQKHGGGTGIANSGNKWEMCPDMRFAELGCCILQSKLGE